MVVVVPLEDTTDEVVDDIHAVLLLLVLGEKEPDPLDVGVVERLAEREGAPEGVSTADARAAADAVPALIPVMEGVAAATPEGVAPRGDTEVNHERVGSAENEPTAETEGTTVALPANSPVMEGVDSSEGVLTCEREARGERDSASDTELLEVGRTVLESEDAPEEERVTREEDVTPPLFVPPPKFGPNVGALAVKVPTRDSAPLLLELLVAEGHLEVEGEGSGLLERRGEADSVRHATVCDGDGTKEREGASEGVGAPLSLREVLSVRVGLSVAASPVRVKLTQAEAVVEWLADVLTRREGDCKGEAVSENVSEAHTLRVMLRVCVSVTRAEAEAEMAPLGEGDMEAEEDAERQRLPVAEGHGERDAPALPEKELDTEAEPEAAVERVPKGVRVPPHRLGPRSGPRGAAAGRGAPVGRTVIVAVAKGGVEGRAGSVGAGASDEIGASVNSTTSRYVAGAFAVPVTSGLRERDCVGDVEKEAVTLGVLLARGERLSPDRELQGVAELERLPLPEEEAEPRSEAQFEVVGLALLLRLSLREPQGEAEAEAEPGPPRPFVTVRVPLAGAVGDPLPQPLAVGGAENVIDAELTSVKESEGVGSVVEVPSPAAREGVAPAEAEGAAEGDLFPIEGEAAAVRLSVCAAPEADGADADGAALTEASEAVGALLPLGASDGVPWEALAEGVEEEERRVETLSVHDAEAVGAPTVADGRDDAAASSDADTRGDRDAEGHRVALGDTLCDRDTGAVRLAVLPGVSVRVPVAPPEVDPDTEGLPLKSATEALARAERDTLREVTSVKVSVSVPCAERDTLGEALSEGVRAARMMVALTVPERLLPEGEGAGDTVRLPEKAPLAVSDSEPVPHAVGEGDSEALPLSEGVTVAEEQREGLAQPLNVEDVEGEPLPLCVPLSVALPTALTLADAASVHVFVPVGATERLTVAQPLAEGLPLCVREARGEALPVPASGKLVLVREEEGATEVVALAASVGLAARDAV